MVICCGAEDIINFPGAAPGSLLPNNSTAPCLNKIFIILKCKEISTVFIPHTHYISLIYEAKRRV